MNLIKSIFCVLVVVFTLTIKAQEIPPIQIFTPQDYGAEDQNWAIDQSDNDYIYVANNEGLLEYNGASWTLYNSPNVGILRSVRVVEDKIYTGGYMDFGYWTKNNQGRLVYSSLSDNQKLSVKEDEDFWGIIAIEGYVLFQSFERIYIYNIREDRFDIINSDFRINKMFNVNGTIYFQKTNQGIYKIENGGQVLLTSEEAIKNKELVNIFESDSGLLLLTRENGFFSLIDGDLESWNQDLNRSLLDLSIYSSARLNDDSFVLGTIANGIIHIDKKGKALLKINQSYGLSNNTVLSIMDDNFGNIWLGLDNGINVINLNSPFKVYTDKQGDLGTVYASASTEEFLYLGTNQGLFYKRLDTNDTFSFIEGTKGQVWSLAVVKGALFCGHDKGTFIINETNVEEISSEIGTWVVKDIEGFPDLLIQGNYKGLNILERIGDTWKYRNKIEGFNISSRYFEFINPHELLVNHEHKGLYKIKIDTSYRRIVDYKKLPVSKGKKSSITTYNNEILYSYKEGVFSYDAQSYSFIKDTVLSGLLSGEKYVSGRLINDFRGKKLWGFSDDSIIYIEPGKLSSVPKVNAIAISSEVRKTKSGFENINELSNNNYLIGTTEGYLIIDLNKIEQKALDINLNSVDYGRHPDELEPLDLLKPDIFKNKSNNIQFKYSVTNFSKLSASTYQYKLIGIYDYWSNWSVNSEVIFKNLPHGDYTFEARAKTDGIISNNVLSYSFTIEKPWYLKPLAIISYFVLALLFIYVLYYFNKKHYKKQQQKLLENKERQLKLEQLENQRQLIQIKNKNLQQNIENKNRELGMATMNLVKRNELLNSIKGELSKSKSLNEVGKVVKLINSSINDTNDWELFEEAFNNVDKDFMKKIKSIHPTITPNDLRLCAYLRLNLSSKEIAPLLNISHKSVEVKRYRLRKKMGLDHDQSLSNYIIDL
ncbi:helix-turn-helix and ligand-binding sensor domain-containing protein [Winogradskyella psychrotolerans]|uniref:helix-turn-helix and ligand-binding sensor domain-containing protein n=1 Tax=Winogradskyella psychrotolerans TaxID=1344585 RepID=UPI001C075370|nr:triple tyrosine motif-containing protein [Winogradskyella psychrotolerans]MBU2929118.1 LuxR C-terminal-related transcriptional regulator [Winogradskyella psychrotolerans]